MFGALTMMHGPEVDHADPQQTERDKDANNNHEADSQGKCEERKLGIILEARGIPAVEGFLHRHEDRPKEQECCELEQTLH